MRKALVVLLIISTLMCGCGKTVRSATTDNDQNTTNSNENNAIADDSASFSEYELNYTDNEGYSFHVECRVSPWILQSNSSVLNATWNSIAKNWELPTINSWGFTKNGNSYTYSEYGMTTFDSKMEDMYYAVGTISITNTTKGFSFSSDRIGCPKVQLVKNSLVDYEKKLITRTYFAKEHETNTMGCVINAKMNSDEWGPVPFVIAYAEHFTPNSPNGENYEKLEAMPLFLAHGEATNSNMVKITIKKL
ncbi:MAG: hypothetical protein E7241_00075 [Lachnospiraceae bacterium]|nr:hypothetical protein [Lachnospiraceae bacterium]